MIKTSLRCFVASALFLSAFRLSAAVIGNDILKVELNESDASLSVLDLRSSRRWHTLGGENSLVDVSSQVHHPTRSYLPPGPRA